MIERIRRKKIHTEGGLLGRQLFIKFVLARNVAAAVVMVVAGEGRRIQRRVCEKIEGAAQCQGLVE